MHAPTWEGRLLLADTLVNTDYIEQHNKLTSKPGTDDHLLMPLLQRGRLIASGWTLKTKKTQDVTVIFLLSLIFFPPLRYYCKKFSSALYRNSSSSTGDIASEDVDSSTVQDAEICLLKSGELTWVSHAVTPKTRTAAVVCLHVNAVHKDNILSEEVSHVKNKSCFSK